MKIVRSVACLLVALGLACSDPAFVAQNAQYPTLHLQSVPKIGETLYLGLFPETSEKILCGVNSAQIDPCATAVIDGISFTITFQKRDDFSYTVTRVFTMDPKFRTKEGLRFGDKITVDGPWELLEEPYFEVYVNRGNEWLPVVGAFGMVNLTFGDKGLKGTKIADIPTPAELAIGGFVERDLTRFPVEKEKRQPAPKF